MDVNTPLKYHMNDLVYYYGQSTGGALGKRIAYLEAMGAMMKGMLYQFDPDHPDLQGEGNFKGVQKAWLREQYARIQNEVDTYILMVDLVSKRHNPLMDTNPYLFKQANRVRKGVQICGVFAYHIIEEHNLVSGNMIRAKLANHFGEGRIKGLEENGGMGDEQFID